MKSTWIKWSLGCIISAIFLYLFLKGIDYQAVAEAFKKAKYLYLIPAVILNILTYWVRALRWQYLMMPIKRISVWKLFIAAVIGFMANGILPARIGEFVRAYVIGRQENVSRSASFATIVVERMLDTITIIITLVLVLSVFPFNRKPENLTQLSPTMQQVVGFLTPDRLTTVGYIFVLLCIGIIVCFIILKFYRELIFKILSFTIKPISEKLYQGSCRIITSFAQGFEILRNWRHLIIVLAYSILLWIVITAGVWVLYPAFDIHLSFLSSFFVITVLAVGVALPSSPGFVGTFHLACTAALVLLAVDENQAKSYAILLWMVSVFPVVIMGLYFLWRQNLSLGEIQKSKAEEPENQELCK